MRFGVFVLASTVLILSGCGGGKSTYTIGGTITGLTGSGLVLQNNGGNNLTVSANATSFAFSTPVASGATYLVTVLTQPAGESCVVTGGHGAAMANVKNVSIACQKAYTIGGQILGLTGSGLVLQDNGGNNLTVSSSATSYAFTFDGDIPSGGAAYSITVLTVPSGQACTVSNSMGTATADVSNANVTCTTLAGAAYTIGGTIAGLTGTGPVLQDNLGINNADLLQIAGNGNFTFADPVVSGGGYDVSVLTQPATRDCVVNNGMGTASANVTNVGVICVSDFTWMGGGNVTANFGSGAAGIYGTLGTASATNIPGGRQQALTWTDASGALWLFGGYGMDSTGSGFGGQLNDLWKFEPGQGTAGEWTWMGGSNLTPASTTFGAAGEPGNYGTLGTASPANIPGGREQVASWVDASGVVWIFGGEGIDANGVTGELNDLWKFDPKQGTNGEWTWMGGSESVGAPFGGPAGIYGVMGTAAAANVPGGRYGAISWVDASGNFWLYGGNGIDSTGPPNPGYLNDLWEYTPGPNETPGEWTWMGGSDVSANGGNGVAGAYGSVGVPSASNWPGARDAGMKWVDSSGDIWLFGGFGADSTGTDGYLNDLWKYTPGTNGAAGEWTWMAGSDSVGNGYGSGQPGVYGTLGSASTSNTPGGRFSGVSWVDKSGKLWLFGGDGEDSSGINGYLNDMWMFDPSLGSSGEWTWMGGSELVGRSGGQSGIYGTLGMPSANNIPGGRFGIAGWADGSGNLWLFGGEGYDSKDNQGNLNDLWQYQP
jgi:N-acetylneuraminic acid mutarotase